MTVELRRCPDCGVAQFESVGSAELPRWECSSCGWISLVD